MKIHTAGSKSLSWHRKLCIAVFLTFLIAYLAFLPTGPYPLTAGGFRVEYLLFTAVCVASLPLLRSSFSQMTGNYARVQLCSLWYVGTIGLTTVLSSDPESSNRAFATTAGYAYLMLIVPPLIHQHMQLLRKALLLMAAATACLLLYLNIALGYGTTQRFALSESAEYTPGESSYVDPNMTAIGMLLCLVMSLPLLWSAEKQNWLYKSVYRILLMAVLGASFLFISRTAAFSLVIAIVFGIIRAKGRGLRPATILRRSIPLLILLVGAAIWRKDDLGRVIDRTVNFRDDEVHATSRTDLFQTAWSSWLSGIKTVVIGDGYYTSNPHNELLRTLVGDGLLGLISLLALLFSVYITCCRKYPFTVGQRFNQNALFAFILSAMMTYGHTKTMWLTFMFLLAGYLEAKNDQRNEWRTAVSQPNSLKPVDWSLNAHWAHRNGILQQE